MLASHLRADLLLPPPSPLQLVGGQGQGHGPQGCGKQDLPQAWCQPQLRECRLQDKRETAGYISPGELLRGAQRNREHTRPLGIFVDQVQWGDSHLKRGDLAAALKCGPQRCKERAGDGKMMMPDDAKVNLGSSRS